MLLPCDQVEYSHARELLVMISGLRSTQSGRPRPLPQTIAQARIQRSMAEEEATTRQSECLLPGATLGLAPLGNFHDEACDSAGNAYRSMSRHYCR